MYIYIYKHRYTCRREFVGFKVLGPHSFAGGDPEDSSGGGDEEVSLVSSASHLERVALASLPLGKGP